MSNTSTLPRRLTETGFCSWVGEAESGDIVEYHRGFLGIDIQLGPLRSRAQGAASGSPGAPPGRSTRASSTWSSAATGRSTSATSRSGGHARGPRGARSASPSIRRAREPELEEAA